MEDRYCVKAKSKGNAVTFDIFHSPNQAAIAYEYTVWEVARTRRCQRFMAFRIKTPVVETRGKKEMGV